jgi:hypothetical protein
MIYKKYHNLIYPLYDYLKITPSLIIPNSPEPKLFNPLLSSKIQYQNHILSFKKQNFTLHFHSYPPLALLFLLEHNILDLSYFYVHPSETI